MKTVYIISDLINDTPTTKVLKLKFYGKPKRNNFSITVKHHNYNNCYCLNWRTNKNGYIVFVGVCIV